MPIIPTYQRQVRYQQPGVEMSSGTPVRIPEAFESSLKDLSVATTSYLDWLDRREEKERRNNAARQAEAAQQGRVDREEPAKPQLYSDGGLETRGGLLDAARQDAQKNGAPTTNALDKFAASHLTAEQSDSPAALDYMLLRRAAADGERETAAASSYAALNQEEKLLRNLGSLASSPKSLDAYLSAQLPGYEARLKSAGLPAEESRARAELLRTDAVTDNIRRSLAAGNWQSAQNVFERNAEKMSEPVRAECAQKIRSSFAASRGEELWNQARFHTDGSPEQNEKWAQTQAASEPDSELKDGMLNAVSRKCEEARQAASLTSAGVYASLAFAQDGESARRVLSSQGALNAEELALATRAVNGSGAAQPRSDSALFNRLYFSAGPNEVARAFEKGSVSARDYYVLQSARHLRESGRPDADGEFLCRGIDSWCEKKGFSAQDGERVKHAVLSSGAGTKERMDALQHIKTLLDF